MFLSTLSHKWHDFRRKLLDAKRVVCFSVQLLFKTLFILRRINHLTLNGHFSGRTAPLTTDAAFFIYSTDMRTEYFKHAAYSLFFSSSKYRLFHNATFFGTCIIHILYTVCAKI